MEELTSDQIVLIIAASIFALVFFVMVTAAIMFFFRRAERGDLAETEEFNESETNSLPNEDSSAH